MRKREKYTVDYFLRKFRAIPLSQWAFGNLRTPDGRRCALGHCGVSLGQHGWPREAAALRDLLGFSVTEVNDRGLFGARWLRSGTPRGRILEALRLVQRRSKRQSKRGAR